MAIVYLLGQDFQGVDLLIYTLLQGFRLNTIGL